MDINKIDEILQPKDKPKALTKIYGTMGICLGEELKKSSSLRLKSHKKH